MKCKPSRKQACYTIAEMHGILTVLKGAERAVMVLAFMGLRPAEIVGLQWPDITSDAIDIQRSMWRGQISDGGKSKHSRRVIPNGPFVRGILAEYRRSSTSISGFVFENSIGKPFNTAGLERMTTKFIRPALEQHGDTWITMYAGRHGAITKTNHHMNGNTHIAAPLFGHSAEVEASHYLHGVPDDARQAALALDTSLSGDLETI